MRAQYAKESTMARQKRRRFSPEFKAEAVRVVTMTDEPLSKIARDLGVTTASLRQWTAAARPQPRRPLTEDERSELLRLRRDIRRVEMERDVLKNQSRAVEQPDLWARNSRKYALRPGAVAVRFLVTSEPVKKHGPGVACARVSGDAVR
jgi:transposase